MGAKKRQTFDKMNRERAVRDRRARKQEKREQRRLAQTEPNGGAAAIEAAPEVGEQAG